MPSIKGKKINRIGPNQELILGHLCRLHPITTRDLIKHTKIDYANLRQALVRLEQKGLVVRYKETIFNHDAHPQRFVWFKK